MIHSGLQLGGKPVKDGKQEQDGVLPCTLHSEFGPHGDGMHGLVGGAGGRASEIQKENIMSLLKYKYFCGKKV